MLRLPFRSSLVVSCLVSATAVACGGATPPTMSPRSEPVADATKPETTPARASAETTESPSTASTSAESKAPEEPVVTRTLADRVFAPRLAYMVNYPLSGVKEAASKQCSAKFPEPDAKAACMDKERAKFTADVLVFEKSDAGTWLTIYKREGNALSQLSKTRLGLGEDTPEHLALKVQNDKGSRPLFAGKKAFEVRFRDEYSIQVDEPRYGSLVYEARIGVLD